MTKTTIEDYTATSTATGESCLRRTGFHRRTTSPAILPSCFLRTGETFQEMDSINCLIRNPAIPYLSGGQPLHADHERGRRYRAQAFLSKIPTATRWRLSSRRAFDEVHVIDFRSFPWNLPDYCAEHGITDVLFFNSEMTAHTSFQIDSMNAMFQ